MEIYKLKLYRHNMKHKTGLQNPSTLNDLAVKCKILLWLNFHAIQYNATGSVYRSNS